MLNTQLTIDYAGTPVTLDRVNQDNYGAVYFARVSDKEYTLEVKHTIPARGKFGESHLVKLSIAHYDAEGLYMRTSSAWVVIKTFDGTQDASAQSTAEALQAFLGETDVIAKVTARQS